MESLDTGAICAAFHRDGYLHLKRFFEPEECRVLSDVATELVAAEEVPGKWMKYFERSVVDVDRELLNRVEGFIDYWPAFMRLMTGPRMRDLLTPLFCGHYFLFKEKLNLKLIGGGGYAPHQDGAAWTMLRHESITLAIPVDRANEANGTLQVDADFNGRRELREHRNGSLASSTDIRWRPLTLELGDVVAFSSYLAHMSTENRSVENRKAYFVTFNHVEDGDQREAYFRYKRAAFPPRIERPEGIGYGAWRKRLSRELL